MVLSDHYLDRINKEIVRISEELRKLPSPRYPLDMSVESSTLTKRLCELMEQKRNYRKLHDEDFDEE